MKNWRVRYRRHPRVVPRKGIAGVSGLWLANIAAAMVLMYVVLGVTGFVPFPSPIDLPFLHGVEDHPPAAAPPPGAEPRPPGFPFPLFPTITGEEEIAPPGPPPGPP